MLRLRNLMLALVMAAVAPASADASLIFNLVDDLAGTVKLTYSGFVTTSDLLIDSSPNNTTNLISPSQGRIRRVGALDVYETNSASLSQPFGSGAQVTATSATGSAVRISFTDPSLIGLPSGYSSNAAISGTMNFTGSLASLGLTAGAYSFNWGVGGAGRTVTLNVSEATPVPEPATLAILAIGSVVSGFGYRRRVRSSKL